MYDWKLTLNPTKTFWGALLSESPHVGLGVCPGLISNVTPVRFKVPRGGGGAEGHSYMKVVYMYRPAFKNGGGGLRERPLTENWGLSVRPTLTEKRGGFWN